MNNPLSVWLLILVFGMLPSRSWTEEMRGDSESSVSITQFLDPVDGMSDATWAVRRALAYCKEKGIRKLIFPKGVYHFQPRHADERLLYISNNDSGVKRVAFLLEGFQKFEIDGQGAQFVFRGYLLPFYIAKSEGMLLKGFSVDFERSFQSEGRILEVGDGSVDVEFGEAFPYKVKEGALRFYGKGDDSQTEYPASLMLEFDPVRKETAFMAQDYYLGSPAIQAEEIAPGRVRVKVPKVRATPGNVFVFGPSQRLVPGITIEDSREITIKDVTLHNSGGMGVIAQRSGDILIDKLVVTPSQGRILSTTADATHFVNCYGKVSLINGRFENQMDDATNIHGVYVRVTRILSPTELEVQLVHWQQAGFDFLHPGLKVELVSKDSLITLGEARVKSALRLNSIYTRVELDQPIPQEVKVNDVLADSEHYPEVLVRGCTIRGNRARGMLMASRGRTMIENNVFHSPGAAILLEGDGSYWFEQAGVRDLTIRGNTFDNCNFGVWGHSTIEVGAGIKPEQRAGSRYNRNITIENNTFRSFDDTPLVSAYCVDGLRFRGNRIEKTTEYPAYRTQQKRFVISDSDNIDIAE